MIDASYIKAHPHVAGARGVNQAMDHTKRALNNQLHLAVDAHGMDPMRLILTEGTLRSGLYSGFDTAQYYSRTSRALEFPAGLRDGVSSVTPEPEPFEHSWDLSDSRLPHPTGNDVQL